MFIVGTEAIAAAALDAGAVAVIAGLANALPEYMQEFYSDMEERRRPGYGEETAGSHPGPERPQAGADLDNDLRHS
ncbi:MAG: hypothetical protein MZV65_15785 [Chromatiales bacterium]|nr:hypothetical protein [Chromatiales bacterium]